MSDEGRGAAIAGRGMPAADRLAFLLALVPWVLDRGRVTVVEAAERFGVSAGLVRSAVRLVAVSGIPGETRQYLDGDLFDIDWDAFEEADEIAITHPVALEDAPRFSTAEAAALIAGLQYLRSLPGNADSPAIATLMAKLARSSSGEPSRIAVAPAGADEALATVRDAVERGRRLVFDYAGEDGARARRSVDPLRVESENDAWYLRAFDHDRDALRTFRLERMTDPLVTAEAVLPASAALAVPERLFAASRSDVVVDVELPRSALPLIAGYRPERPRAVGGDRVATRLRVARLAVAARLAASLPGVLEITGPPAARAAARERAAAGLAGYGETVEER